MKADPKIRMFWNSYRVERSAEAELGDVFAFGDSPAMANELGELVRIGDKVATASLLWEYEADAEAIPKVGQLSIVTDGAGEPLCIIETTEVEIRQFNQVDAEFAYDEGEGDRTLESWRAGHRDFFGRVCATIGREPSEDMPVVCERFSLIFPPQ